MKFKVTPHSFRPGVQVVEVFDDDGVFIATITEGDQPRQIKIISKYMYSVGPAPYKIPPVPVAIARLSDKPVTGAEGLAFFQRR